MLGRRGLDILPMCIEAKSYYLKNAGYTLPLLYMEHDVKKKRKKKKEPPTMYIFPKIIINYLHSIYTLPQNTNVRRLIMNLLVITFVSDLRQVDDFLHQ
jgi:hypothetical protein